MLDIQAEQYEQGQRFQELYEAVLDLKRRHDLHPCSLRAGDGLTLRREGFREQVQDLLARFRSLPEEQQRRLPALLNSLAQLEVVVGDIEGGQHDFQQVARIVVDPISRAEAHHNVYHSALERRDWAEALLALQRAVTLDADAFEPFPFAHYAPQALLGAGGFGPSFLCRERPAQGAEPAPVVVKVLRAESLDRDLGTLLREFETIQQIDHPALVRIRALDGFESQPPRPYLALEYIKGVTLSEYVATHGVIPPEEWMEIAWPIARALQVLHGRGILHRSLRPGCILVHRDKTPVGKVRWHVKVLDTGLSLKRSLIHASSSHPDARLQTGLGRSVARTVAYAPPEVVGRPKGYVWVGPHSDIYSFGRVCAFALTGRPDPDGGDRLLLPEGWTRLLGECCSWTIKPRLAQMTQVLERLATLPGSGDHLSLIERHLYESTISEYSRELERDPEYLPARIQRGHVYLAQADHESLARAAEDYSSVLNALLSKSPEDKHQVAQLYRCRGLALVRGNTESGVAEAIADFTAALEREPHSVEVLTQRGLAYAQQGEQDRALTDFSEGLRLNPRDETLLLNRANLLFSRGEYDRAISDYSDLIRLVPQHTWAWNGRAKAYTLRGDYQRAVADLTQLLQLDPGNVRVLIDRASAWSFLGKPDRAVSDYTAALQRDPNFPDASGLLYERGQAAVAAGQLEAALEDFSAALERDPNHAGTYLARANLREFSAPEEALADLTRALELQPDLAIAYFQRANIYARQGHHDRAVSDFSEAIRQEPSQLAAWFCRGNSYAALNDHDAASADFTECLRLDPRDPASLTNRGNSLSQLGDLHGALADYERSLEIDPADVNTRCNRASAYARLNQWESALAEYQEAIRTDPQYPRGYTGRAMVRAEQGDITGAIRDLTEVIRLNSEPSCSRALVERARLRLYYPGVEEEETGADRETLALEDLNEAVRLDTEYAHAYYYRANLFSDREDLESVEKAVADYSVVLKYIPNHLGALNNRGNARRRLGDLQAALTDFSTAIAVDPGAVLPYQNRARLRAELGDEEGTLMDLNEVLRLDPEDLNSYLMRARIHLQRDNFAAALADNQQVLQRMPDSARVCNNLAWILATCPDPAIRNGPQGLEYARQACMQTGFRDPGFLDTLAAAHAACGEFEDAIHWQEQAVGLAAEAEQPEYRTRLEKYRASQAYEQK